MPTSNNRSEAGATSQVAGMIGKFDPAVARLIRDCRRVLRARFPTANEIVYDNYNFFVIGYSPTARPSDTVVSIAAASSGVALSFYRGADLPDPAGALLGAGVQGRFVRLPKATVLRDPTVVALIDSAVRLSSAPFPERGRIRTIVKSISAKQRPRRRETV